MLINILNRLKKTSLLLVTLALASCSLTPAVPDSIAPSQGKKIAVLVDANQYPTHTHFGNAFSREFVKDLDTDWHIEESIIQTIREHVEKHTDYKVVNLRTFGVRNSDQADLVRVKGVGWAFHEDKADIIKKLQDNGVNLIINISEENTQASEYCPFESPSDCLPLYSQGYGVVSEANLLGIRFYASASFKTTVESISPPSNLTYSNNFRGINSYLSTNRELRYNEVPRSQKRITKEELAPFKVEVLEHFSDVSKRIVNYVNGTQPTFLQTLPKL